MQQARRFDWITNPGVPAPPKPCNTIVAQTDSFVALPSQGSLVPGWLLVIPRRPLINLAQLWPRERDELNLFVARLHDRLAVFPGRVFEFEHGARTIGSATGCGVDQAHLHVVPLPFNLLQACRQTSLQWSYASSRDELPPEFAPDSEYLFARERGNSAICTPVIDPVSQWFRKLIAANLDIADLWDYRAHPFNHAVRKTLDLIKPAA